MSETIETFANLEAIHGPDFLEAVNSKVNIILAEQDRILLATVKILLPAVGGTFITDSAQRAVDKIAALQSEREALRAQLDAQWQPIESAPKDGTSVLLIIPVGMDVSRPPIYVGAYYGDEWYTYGASCSGRLWRAQPTHWRALPEPPVSQQG